MTETTPATQRTEETLPEEIRAAMERFGRQAYAYGCRAGELVGKHVSARTLSEMFTAAEDAADALESAIASALGVQADRIAELEAKVGTLTVALEMSRTSLGDAQRRAESDNLDAVEAQIRALSKRIGLADNGDLELIGKPSWSVLVPSRWRVRWRRSYCPHGSVVSDWREVEAESLPEALAAAEEWESENDQREPQYAVSLARESAKESK